MAKTTGLGDKFFIEGYDVSGDIGSIQSIMISRALLDVTGIDKDAFERLPGLGDCEMNFKNWFNPADGSDLADPRGAHDILKTLTDSRHAMYQRGTEPGAVTAMMVGSQATYALTRSNTGALEGTVSVKNSNGVLIEWGQSLT